MSTQSPHEHFDRSQSSAELRPQRRARSYIFAFVAAGIGVLVLFYGGLAVLGAFDRLSPPPVSGTWCIDSRFSWLRQNPEWQDAEILAVGSSVTWRNLDFSVLPSETRERGLVNVAPCFLRLNQTRYLTEFFLERASSLKTVVTVLALRDFEHCSRTPTVFFDPESVDRYIAGHTNEWWLRFSNFRVADVFLHAVYADERRPQMVYDRFGSGPLTKKKPEIGWPRRPEAQCFAELRRLAMLLESRGVRFVVVTFPLMGGWAREYDKMGQVRSRFAAEIKAALASTNAILVDGVTDWCAPDSAFTDPDHLQWPETAAFTRFVWETAGAKAGDFHAFPRQGQARLAGHLDGRNEERGRRAFETFAETCAPKYD